MCLVVTELFSKKNSLLKVIQLDSGSQIRFSAIVSAKRVTQANRDLSASRTLFLFSNFFYTAITDIDNPHIQESFVVTLIILNILQLVQI